MSDFTGVDSVLFFWFLFFPLKGRNIDKIYISFLKFQIKVILGMSLVPLLCVNIQVSLALYSVFEVENSLTYRCSSAKFELVIGYISNPTPASGTQCDLSHQSTYQTHKLPSGRGGNANIQHTGLGNNIWCCEPIRPLLTQRQDGPRPSH